MAAGWVSALSFSFVSVVFGCYKAVNQVNHNPLFAFCHLALSNFPVTPASQPSPGCAGLTWQLTVWRVGRVSPAFILGSVVHRQACAQTLSGLFELFLPFEMASQRPCMINVTTLAHIVVPKAPAEYLKHRGFLFCFFLNPLSFVCQSAP